MEEKYTQKRDSPIQVEPSGLLEPEGSTNTDGSLTFHDIRYTVQVKAPGTVCGSMPKEILMGINGVFKPGMNAIMGPTGGGKSSLLDVLAGRKDPRGLEGNVLVNGKKQPSNFKCISGYVVQDDVVMGTLTVRENFAMSANLRLSSSISAEDKRQRVNDTIEELALGHCADSKVGTEFIRGVSGGERKRCNIGMELIISPTFLFLDEPTTGLDANTANSVMSLLAGLSRKNRTIVFSIHQPRFSIFRLFDRFMLLGRGKAIYHGPAAEAMDFFTSLGYVCETFNNPPDFFLDVVNGDEIPQNGGNQIEEVGAGSGRASKVSNGSKGGCVVDLSETEETKAEKDIRNTNMLAEKYMQSHWFQDVTAEVGRTMATYKEHVQNGNGRHDKQPDYATSFPTQLKWLSKRAVLNLWRNPAASFMQVIVSLVFGLIVGLIYFDLGDIYRTDVQNRAGAFFFIVMNMVFSNLSAVELFIQERVIFIHENVSGFYRVSSYFMAKVCCDLIPMRVLPIIGFSVIVYFMLGLEADVEKFFIFMLTLILTTLCAAGLGFAVSASVRVFAIANLGIALIYVFMMVFGGLLVNLDDIAAWLRWLQYFSIFRYSLNALNINEMKGKVFCGPTIVNGSQTYDPCTPFNGNEYLIEQGIDYETSWDLWKNEMALAILTLGFLLIAYIQLRRIQKLK